MEEEKKSGIYKVTAGILKKIYGQLESSGGKALLSGLRRSAGRTDILPVEMMSVIFESFPEQYLGRGYPLSCQESSVLVALQMYAIHQQGECRNVHQEKSRYENLGTSLRMLRSEDDSTSIDRRFNAMITSDTYEEFTTHIRYLIQILKSKHSETTVDFAGLARDLYCFQLSAQTQEQIRLTWSREYYKRNIMTGDERDDEQ